MLDPEDRCKYGHQLAPGSTPINVGKLPNGKPDVKLLRRHAVTEPSVLDPHGHDWRVQTIGGQLVPVPVPECVRCSTP